MYFRHRFEEAQTICETDSIKLVGNQVFKAIIWILIVNDFGKAVHHVGSLIKSNLRYQKLLYLATFLVEEHVSTWRQLNLNQSSEVYSSRARVS